MILIACVRTGTIMEVSAPLARLLGYTPEQLAGAPVDLIAPDDTEAWRARIARLLPLGVPMYVGSRPLLHRDGHAVWARGRITFDRDSQRVSITVQPMAKKKEATR